MRNTSVRNANVRGRALRLAAGLAVAIAIALATASVAFAATNIPGDPLPQPQPFDAYVDGTTSPTVSAVYDVYLEAGDVLWASQNDTQAVVFAVFAPSATDIYKDNPVDAALADFTDIYYKAAIAGHYQFVVYPDMLEPTSGTVSLYAGVLKNTSWTRLDPLSQTTTVAFDSDIDIWAGLKDFAGPVAFEPVSILRQYVGGPVEKIATVWTDQDGQSEYFAPIYGLQRRATFTFAFEGEEPSTTDGSGGLASAYIQTTLIPRAYLTTPVTPSVVTHGRGFTAYGYLKPRHTSGSYAVKLYFYRSERQSNGTYKWVSRKTVNARLSNVTYGGVAASKYGSSTSAWVSVPYAGKWRVRAYHGDADHAATYTTYRYFTAK